MTRYFYELLVAGWRGIGAFEETTASGGSTTTAIDANYAISGEKYGTFVCLYDAAGAGAAPQGEFSRISSVSGTTTTFDAITTAIASGDRVGFASSLIKLPKAKELVNQSLRNMGNIEGVVDNTSLTTVNDQTEYALPVAAKNNLLDVQIETNTTDANDNRYQSIPYKVLPATGGSTGLLIIDQYPANYSLQLIYNGEHPHLEAYNDPLQEAVPFALAQAAVVYEFYNWITNFTQNADTPFRTGFNKAASQLEEAMEKHTTWSARKRQRILEINVG